MCCTVALSSMEKIRILLADDHPEILTYLSSRLRREGDLEIVGEAINSAQAIALALTEKPHIVLIDPMMRDGLGLSALRQIATRYPEGELVVLTAVADTAEQMSYKKIGVQRVLIKGLESAHLINELRDIVQAKEGVEEPVD